jgi:hypothetical protein
MYIAGWPSLRDKFSDFRQHTIECMIETDMHWQASFRTAYTDTGICQPIGLVVGIRRAAKNQEQIVLVISRTERTQAEGIPGGINNSSTDCCLKNGFIRHFFSENFTP